MKPQEAIGIIKTNWPDKSYTILGEAMNAAIEALEKQVPKIDTKEVCPNCQAWTWAASKEPYCCHCGQMLRSDIADRSQLFSKG